jgi:hypothetical protein
MTEPKRAEDRRRAIRVEKIQLVQVSRFDEQGSCADLATGRTANLSREGIRLELSHPLPLRSVVHASIALGNDLVSFTGRVIYLEELDGQRTAVGIAFAEVSPETRMVIDRHLAAAGT